MKTKKDFYQDTGRAPGYSSPKKSRDFYQETGTKPGADIKKEEAPEEESAISKLPKNILAGFGDLGHSLLNSPHDLIQGAESSLQGLLPGGANQLKIPGIEQQETPEYSVSEHIPKQKDYKFAKMLGQKGEGTLLDNIIQGGIKYSPEILGGAAFYRDLPIALTRRGASRELRQAQNLARERNINNLNIPREHIEDSAQFLPTSRSYQNLLNDAHEGAYDSLFALQSDLGHASRGFSRNPFSFAERRHGREAGRTRDTLIHSMREALTEQGHADIADLLRRGQQRYRNYNRLKPVRNLGIGVALSQMPYGQKILRALSHLGD